MSGLCHGTIDRFTTCLPPIDTAKLRGPYVGSLARMTARSPPGEERKQILLTTTEPEQRKAGLSLLDSMTEGTSRLRTDTAERNSNLYSLI